MSDNLAKYITVDDSPDFDRSEPEEIFPDMTPEEKLAAIKEQASLKETLAADIEKYVDKIVASYNLTGNVPEQHKDLGDYINAVEDNMKHEAMLKGKMTQGAQLVLDRIKLFLFMDGVLNPKAISDLIEYVNIYGDTSIPAKDRKKLMENLEVGMDYIGTKHIKYSKELLGYIRAFYGLCSMLDDKGTKKEDYGAILMRASSKKSQPKRKNKEGRPTKKLNPMLDVEEIYGEQNEESMEGAD